MLDQRLATVEKDLVVKEKALLQARKDCGDIVINENSEQSHPIVQRVNRLNQGLTEVSSKRIELESMLASARSLVAAGADLTLAVQKLQDMVGDNVMSQLPGAGKLPPLTSTW